MWIESKQKKAALGLAAAVFAALLFCTALSAAVYDAHLPRVTAFTPQGGVVGGESYPMVAPAACVYRDADGAYVFRLQETDTGWKVERCAVTVLASDGQQTAIRRALREEIRIAAEPTLPLRAGDAVKLME